MKRFVTMLLPLVCLAFFGCTKANEYSPSFEQNTMFNKNYDHIIYIVAFAVVSLIAIVLAVRFYKKRK